MTAFGLQQHQYLQPVRRSCKIGRGSGQSKENDWNEAPGASFLSLRVGKGLSGPQAPLPLRGRQIWLRDAEAKSGRVNKLKVEMRKTYLVAKFVNRWKGLLATAVASMEPGGGGVPRFAPSAPPKCLLWLQKTAFVPCRRGHSSSSWRRRRAAEVEMLTTSLGFSHEFWGEFLTPRLLLSREGSSVPTGSPSLTDPNTAMAQR